MIIEWLLMAVISNSHNVSVPVQQAYSTQAECEAARTIWPALTPSQFVWVKSVCVKKVKT